LLGGYSAGGMVAFEMAAVLRGQGQEVSLLVLLDSWIKAAPALTGSEGIRTSIFRKALTGTVRRISQVRKLKGAKRWGVVSDDISRFWSTIKLLAYSRMRALGLPSFRLDLQTAFLLAIRNYRPKPLNLRAVLFLADEEAHESYTTLGQAWQKLASDLQVHYVKAKHDELVLEPLSHFLATEIKQQLMKSQANDCEASANSPQLSFY
jgi:thioesterase domain-containing protein